MPGQASDRVGVWRGHFWISKKAWHCRLGSVTPIEDAQSSLSIFRRRRARVCPQQRTSNSRHCPPTHLRWSPPLEFSLHSRSSRLPSPRITVNTYTVVTHSSHSSCPPGSYSHPSSQPPHSYPPKTANPLQMRLATQSAHPPRSTMSSNTRTSRTRSAHSTTAKRQGEVSSMVTTWVAVV